MKYHPTVFSAPMVLALLNGRKTQTRRVVSAANSTVLGYRVRKKSAMWRGLDFGRAEPRTTATILEAMCGDAAPHDMHLNVPFQSPDDPVEDQGLVYRVRPIWEPGDRLWVRETCSAVESHDGLDCVRYEADQVWRPIEDTGDAAAAWLELYCYRKKRGATVPPIHMPRWASRITLEITDVRVQRLQEISDADIIAEGCPPEYLLGTNWYRPLWETITGAGSWDANPWVWARTFRRVTP